MGSKTCLLVHVYEWPLMKCKIWYQFFKTFPNLSQLKKIAEIWENMEKSGDFAQNFAHNRADWYFYGSTFKFRGGTPLLKPKLSNSRALKITYFSFLKFQSFRPRGSKELEVWSGQGYSSVTWHPCIPAPIKIHLFPKKRWPIHIPSQ